MTKSTGAKNSPDQLYIYCGDGLGVPGLPHRLTRKDAENRGLLASFEAAVARGDYQQSDAEHKPEKAAEAGKEE